MFVWLILFGLGFPLVVFLVQTKAREKARQRRLSEIQSKLQEKQIAKIAEKRARIQAKSAGDKP